MINSKFKIGTKVFICKSKYNNELFKKIHNKIFEEEAEIVSKHNLSWLIKFKDGKTKACFEQELVLADGSD